MGQIDLMCLLRQCTEKDTSVAYSDSTNQASPIWETFYKQLDFIKQICQD